ncbi:MAG TPA: winged helix-turn-helix domain-containing protein, partial [Burkholderiaceae bacterium]|nr:winged helix-turn-helix domain-containing protein [Burkholderiaceae bacterium]
MPLDLATLRRYALARSLISPTTLPLALQRMVFVRAYPSRAPARA